MNHNLTRRIEKLEYTKRIPKIIFPPYPVDPETESEKFEEFVKDQQLKGNQVFPPHAAEFLD